MKDINKIICVYEPISVFHYVYIYYIYICTKFSTTEWNKFKLYFIRSHHKVKTICLHMKIIKQMISNYICTSDGLCNFRKLQLTLVKLNLLAT